MLGLDAQATPSSSSTSSSSAPTSASRSWRTLSSAEFWGDDPVEHLRAKKQSVAFALCDLQKLGKEGMGIIKRQPLRARGPYEPLIMADGSPLPKDLAFWTKQLHFVTQEWRQITRKDPYGPIGGARTSDPCRSWIWTWLMGLPMMLGVDEAAPVAAVRDMQSKRLETAIIQYSTSRKRPHDKVSAMETDTNLPPKRPKRDSPHHLANGNSQAAFPHPNTSTAAFSATASKTSLGMQRSQKEQKLQTPPMVPRRSCRIAALPAAKPGFYKTALAGRPSPAAVASTTKTCRMVSNPLS